MEYRGPSKNQVVTMSGANRKKGERKEDLGMTNKTGRRNYPFVGAGKDSAGDVGIVGASEQREREFAAHKRSEEENTFYRQTGSALRGL